MRWWWHSWSWDAAAFFPRHFCGKLPYFFYPPRSPRRQNLNTRSCFTQDLSHLVYTRRRQLSHLHLTFPWRFFPWDHPWKGNKHLRRRSSRKKAFKTSRFDGRRFFPSAAFGRAPPFSSAPGKGRAAPPPGGGASARGMRRPPLRSGRGHEAVGAEPPPAARPFVS